MPDDFKQIVLAPIVATTLATTAVVVQDWARGRRQEAQGLRNLDLAAKKLAYFESLLSLNEHVHASQRIPDLEGLIGPELLDARELAVHGWAEAQRPRRTFKQFVNYVLLSNARGSPSVFILKLLYWFSLFNLLVAMPAYAWWAVAPADPELKAAGLVQRVLILVMSAFISLLPVLIFRNLATWRMRSVANRRSRRAAEVTSSDDVGDESTDGSPPAGWYGDPGGRHQHRYWDGTSWTDHLV